MKLKEFFKDYKFAFLYGFVMIAAVQWSASLLNLMDNPDAFGWSIAYIWLVICLYADYQYNNYLERKEEKNA